MSKNRFTAPRLTSGNREVVSLVNGLGYGGGPTPGIYKQWDFAILNTSFTALAWNFSIHVNGAFIAGIAGPGWGTGTFDDELLIGVSPDTTISLGGGAPYTEAGFLFGASVKFAIRVKISGWKGVRWVGGWHGHFENIWGTITDVIDEAQIDLLAIIVEAILWLYRRGQAGPLGEVVARLKPASANPNANWSLLDKTNSALAGLNESATDLLPQLAVRVDISQFIAPVRAFNAALSKVGSSVAFGPTFGIGFPIHIQVEGVVLDGAVYRVTATHTGDAKKYFDGTQNNLVDGTAPSGMGTAGYRPTTVGLRYKWDWGIDITVGVYCQISIFWVLSISPEFHFGLLSLLGIPTTVQTKRGDLTNRSFAYQNQVAEHDLPQPLEVVFEDPTPAWS